MRRSIHPLSLSIIAFIVMLCACSGATVPPIATTIPAPPASVATAKMEPTAAAQTSVAVQQEFARVPFPPPASCATLASPRSELRRNFPAFWYDGNGIGVGNATAAFYEGDNKVMWQTVDNTSPTITGERLDAIAPPMRVENLNNSSGGYISGVVFPTAGCWHVSATANQSTFDARVYVYPGGCVPAILRDPRSTPAPCITPAP